MTSQSPLITHYFVLFTPPHARTYPLYILVQYWQATQRDDQAPYLNQLFLYTFLQAAA